MKHRISLVALFFLLLYACSGNKKTETVNYPILHASLDEIKMPLDKLFGKIEIIPLETKDESLIKYISKIDYSQGRYYIFDDDQFFLFFFDDKGNYINRIAKIGQGPGEYTLIYDFAINENKNRIEMLSPYKFIYCYDYDGNFIKKYDLPTDMASYQGFRHIDNDNFVLWSTPDVDQDGISIVSQETGELVNRFWKDNLVINFFNSNVFHSYNNEIFYKVSLYNKVYKITPNGTVIAYEWNFGNKTMDITQHDILFKGGNKANINKDMENLINKCKSKEILYYFLNNFQTKQYYYAKLSFEYKTSKHLFYNKETEKSYFFERPAEGIKFNPRYFSDDFIVGVLDYEDKDKLLDSPLLDETSKDKLRKSKEEDNPLLIKYYFKK